MTRIGKFDTNYPLNLTYLLVPTLRVLMVQLFSHYTQMYVHNYFERNLFVIFQVLGKKVAHIHMNHIGENGERNG